MDIDYKIIQDPTYGYKRLDPIPSGDKLDQFYESQYYDLIRRGGRAPDIRRLMAGGKKAQREREWTTATTYTDIAYCLKQYAPGKRILDVGCGTGEFVTFLNKSGLRAEGIEPAAEAVEMAQSSGLEVSQTTLETYAQRCSSAFDAITFLDVLEHIPDPAKIIQEAKGLLSTGGCLCVRSPNDFNDLQIAARRKLEEEPWWIAIPDHINYFDFSSLEFLLNELGFEVVYTQGDFPMALFLLMGEEYIGNPEIGKACHWKRVDFETSISATLRRRIYQALAEVEVGRHILMVAKKVTD